MAYIMQIPTYTYFGNQQMQTYYPIYCSTPLYNRLRSGTISYEVTGNAADNNPAKIVNNYLNESIITNKMPFYMVKKSSDKPVSDVINMGLSRLDINYSLLLPSNNSDIPTEILSVGTNDSLGVLDNSYPYGVVNTNSTDYATNIRIGNPGGTYFNINSINQDKVISGDIVVFPENAFEGGKFNQSAFGNNTYGVKLTITFIYRTPTTTTTKFNTVRIAGPYNTAKTVSQMAAAFGDYDTSKDLLETEQDPTNPYAYDGNSGIGGGDGDFVDQDYKDPADFASLPTIDAADLGFCTIYNPSKAQLKALASFMWSNSFDLDTYKKLFSDPMESIIGLAIVPVAPSIGGAKNVQFGIIDSGLSMSYCTSQFVKKNMGSCYVGSFANSFLDSTPYTKVSIYLPCIGIQQLSADDVIGHTLEVEYNIDILSGACCAMIKVSGRGVLYSYNGSCISNIPLSAINFSASIQNAISTVCSVAAIVAGIASGSAPISAMGAAGLASNAANAAINAKPSVQRSGSLGGSAGIMSILRPYLIIERPDVSVPANIAHHVGQTSNITTYLYNCSGFTMVDSVHLNGFNATSEELKEIDALLKQGVIL